jgi:hypothetical protein
MERRAFRYFVEQAHPRTGLVKDRASNFGKDDYTVTSMAATGFGMAALVIGSKRGYIPRKEAYQKALRTLQTAAKLPHEHGWLYHFLDGRTGERAWKSEVSTIDTALWIAGALAAGEYFKGTEVERLARRLYDRMDFNWMRTDGGTLPHELTISMGWRPETGFIHSRWHEYSEHLILNLLALSSSTHPVPAECWTAWERDFFTVGPYRGLGLDLPLFVHQYTHCFVNLKNRPDGQGTDYWRNSVIATEANRWYCESKAKEFAGLGPNVWGLSAVDGPDGYRAYGPVDRDMDGTISPIGVVAALPFLPKESENALETMKARYGDHIWGKYGFSPFNVQRDWWGPDIIGIDVGAALLMLDRYRYKDDLIPNLLERAALRRGLKRAGFAARRLGKS